jgi:hypothetical protein
MAQEGNMYRNNKLLVDENEAIAMLSISNNDLEWLLNTQQLSHIQIRGRRLFEVVQLEQLVQSYKTVQSRGN